MSRSTDNQNGPKGIGTELDQRAGDGIELLPLGGSTADEPAASASSMR